MSLISRICGSLEARLSQPHFNLWRTAYLNFRTLPYKQAIKFPIYVYGKVRFFMLNGSISISDCAIKRGMVKIGVNGDSFSLSDGSGFIQLASPTARIEFQGPCRIALNSKIRVADGILQFGKYSRIGTGSKIICNGGRISIGAFTGITFGCTMMNSSFHYTYDLQLGAYRNRTKNIVIGERNWIGNQTTILGGTLTKNDTIVGTGSLLNRDYTRLDGEYPMIAGRPAKLLRLGVKRVFAPDNEVRISKLFDNEKSDSEIVLSPEFPDDPGKLIVEM